MTTPAVTPANVVNVELHATGEVHRLWRWMRMHTPVHWSEPGLLPGFWSLTRYEDIRAVYESPDLFSSAQGVLLRPVPLGEDPGSGLTLALTDPPRHRALRAQIASRFSERCARGMESVMRAEVRSVLTRAAELGTCDLVHDIGARLSSFSISRILGAAEEDHEQLLVWTQEAFEAGKPLTSHQGIMSYLIDMMYARMADPTEDAVSMLTHNEADGELLTETEILLNCENLVGASENAGLAIAAGVLAFQEHPDQWRRIEQDPSLIRPAVEEVLRWTSSATHSMRTATRDTVLGGRQIMAGNRIVLWIPSANRDEAVFEDPYRFNVGRQPNRHLALGMGEHVCIGGTMARHQLRLFLTEMLTSVRTIERLGPVVPLRSIAVNGPAHCPIRIALR